MRPVRGVFGAKVLDYALRFLSSVLIARALLPHDKGVLTFAMLVVTWTVTLGNFSLTDATVYLVGKRAVSPAEAMAAVLWFSVVAGLLYGVALFALVFFHVVGWPVGRPGLFYLLLGLIPLNLLLGNFTGILQGLSLFRAYNFFAIFRSASLLAGVALGVWICADNLSGVGRALLATGALNALLLGLYLGRQANFRFPFSMRHLKQALHYGLRGHISVVLATITMRFDQFVLGAMLAPSQLGLYATAVTISEVPHLLSDAVGTVLFPRVAGDPAGAAAVTARACRLTALVMLVAAVGLAAAAVPLVLIFGAPFLPAAQPLYILAPGIVFVSMSKVLTKYIYGVGRPQLCICSTVASAAVTVAMIIPMVKRYGILGAAVTSTAAYAVGAVVDLLITVRLSALRPSEFLLPRKPDLAWRDWVKLRT